MKIEYKNLFDSFYGKLGGELPEVLVGWKVTKSEHRKLTVLERSGASETFQVPNYRPARSPPPPRWRSNTLFVLQVCFVCFVMSIAICIFCVFAYVVEYVLLEASKRLQTRFSFCSWTISPEKYFTILILFYSVSFWLLQTLNFTGPLPNPFNPKLLPVLYCIGSLLSFPCPKAS